MAMYTSDTVYQGEETFVLSIDIGTTHSAVTFSHVYPGGKPEVRSVLKWPGQEDAAGDSKIPTMLAYQRGELKVCGAEAAEYLDDDEYEIARWFKLHLHPESMSISDQPPPYDAAPNDGPPSIEIPELPDGVSLQQAYVDFLRYLCKMARAYFVKSTPNGSNIWDRLQNRRVVVLSTPNGWDIAQHAFLRVAAIKAGLVEEIDSDVRIQFITEGEASVHFALAHTNGNEWLEEGTMFAVVDAGGSTVDSTLYQCQSTKPLVLEEVCASECVQAGGIFVDRAARVLLKEKLNASRYGGDDWVTAGVRAFERKTKRVFDGSQTLNVVAFGSPGDNDRSNGVIKGKLSLTKEEVSSTFEDVASRTVRSCLKLLRGRNIQYFLLVGGFGESPYLRERLAELLRGQGTQIITVDEPSKKAAAEGATIWFIKQHVKARASRCTYGMEAATNYDPTIHSEHAQMAFFGIDGRQRIPVFDPIVEKNTVIPKDWQKINHYSRKFGAIPHTLEEVSVEIFAWGKPGMPLWVRNPNGQLSLFKLRRLLTRYMLSLRSNPTSLMPGHPYIGQLVHGMRRLCVLKADMSGLEDSLIKRKNRHGHTYWRLDYDVVMSFNRSELQAKLIWEENGQPREGPVTILPQSTF